MRPPAFLKSAVRGVMPAGYERVAAWYRAVRERRFQARVSRAVRRLNPAGQATVVHGPFAGMRYGSNAFCSAYLPKLVGSYEAELHPVIRAAASRPYMRLIDIGCAEGYYAVGMARMMPTATVEAFDTDARARDLCRQLASENGVADRVRLHGHCDAASLARMQLQGALVICDAEGAESELLSPDAVPGLAMADILVETHDFYVPGVTNQLVTRFGATHVIEVIESVRRDPGDWPVTGKLPAVDRALAVDEIRPAQAWLWMRSNALAATANGGEPSVGVTSAPVPSEANQDNAD